MSIGANIKEQRVRQKVTQKQLAERLYVSQQAVQQWESDKTVLQADRLTEVADALSVPVLSLLYDDTILNPCIQIDISRQIQRDMESEDKITQTLAKLYQETHSFYECSVLLTEYEEALFQNMKILNSDLSATDFLLQIQGNK